MIHNIFIEFIYYIHIELIIIYMIATFFIMKKFYLSWIICAYVLTCFSNANFYWEEMEHAYNYAYKNWITTMQSIDKAWMYSELNRISMAKMISNFAINILWLKVDTSLNCSFYDVSISLDTQYDLWVTKACQLWLMWIGDDWKIATNFNPYGIVTRWQFATAFSRALNKSAGTSINNWNPYYRPHINYLYNKWIINSLDTPASNHEKRWYVMLMMQRASNWISNNLNNENNTCNTNENCLEYLNKLYKEKNELTCIYDDGQEDYIMEWYVTTKSNMFNMLATNSITYLWWWWYWENQWIQIETWWDVTSQRLSSLSKLLKLWTKITCTPWVTDKSVFQLPKDITIMSIDDLMDKDLKNEIGDWEWYKIFSINGYGGDDSNPITHYQILNIDKPNSTNLIYLNTKYVNWVNFNLSDYYKYIYLKLTYSNWKILGWSLVDKASLTDIGKLSEQEIKNKYSL